MNTKHNMALTAGLLALSLFLWELGVRVFEVPGYIFPPPSLVLKALWRGISSGLYLEHGAYTLAETFVGFVIAAVVGVLLGAVVATNKYVDYFLYPYIVMFQALPKVALAPLFALWFGLGMPSKIVSAATIAFFPLMINTIVGLRSADEDRVLLMQSLGATKTQVFWHLRLPNALPFVLAGMDIAIVLALIGAIVAEFVGAQAGLGTVIQQMNFNLDVSGQFSVLILLSVFGLLLSRVIVFIRRRVLFWDASEKSRNSQ
ncbi:ABC transporter permease [Variovorax sp. Sphag1AA]|uniref:ABC transporter permease n=1 Tax=Variovorax sp. Sphag1AA TaxID=2587027 RepID=UPI00160E555E|nr:ABC transporter permease [Variovorax sp. Sphag1AA]MBB3181634.1 NitT/TauT family transport system permease protein [Variovorax sp. Sphag1AA]